MLSCITTQSCWNVRTFCIFWIINVLNCSALHHLIHQMHQMIPHFSKNGRFTTQKLLSCIFWIITVLIAVLIVELHLLNHHRVNCRVFAWCINPGPFVTVFYRATWLNLPRLLKWLQKSVQYSSPKCGASSKSGHDPTEYGKGSSVDTAFLLFTFAIS